MCMYVHFLQFVYNTCFASHEAYTFIDHVCALYMCERYIRSKILHGAWGTGCVGHVSKLGPDDVAGTYASSPPNLNHSLEICSVCD